MYVEELAEGTCQWVQVLTAKPRGWAGSSLGPIWWREEL